MTLEEVNKILKQTHADREDALIDAFSAMECSPGEVWEPLERAAEAHALHYAALDVWARLDAEKKEKPTLTVVS